MKKGILLRLSVTVLFLAFLVGCGAGIQKDFSGTGNPGNTNGEQVNEPADENGAQNGQKADGGQNVADTENEQNYSGKDGQDFEDTTTNSPDAVEGIGSQNTGKTNEEQEIDYNIVKPDESGKIMIVMFHNFIEEYKGGDRLYTTTFSDFRKLLEELYEKEYRLISLSDYINGNINVEAGCKPIVFTFDDGSAGQFNLVIENGRLTANKLSAVGIMEEFYKEHPDFGLTGIFYVNLGLNTFPGEGSINERLSYLIDKGFEIGNHTFSHVKLSQLGDSRKIQEEIGGNCFKILEILPGYTMKHFALPYGERPPKELRQYLYSGEYNGVTYELESIVEVGWDPAPSPFSSNFDPMALHRVTATGLDRVDCDLAWWLERLSRKEQYISDGNPDTVTVPSGKETMINMEKLGERKLIVY